MKKGQVHLYTGNGKGKTTAAFGLALRAIMAGKTVYIGQFIKSMQYNETKITQYFDQIKIEQLGGGCIFGRKPDEADRKLAKEGLDKCVKALTSGNWDVVILDEITIAIHLGLIDCKEVIDSIEKRANHVEVILTGRYAPESLIKYADLVTEMKEVKHYYHSKGILSRDGIDK